MNTKSLDLESGSSQYAYNSSPSGLPTNGDMTIEMWIKLESFTSNDCLIQYTNNSEDEADNSQFDIRLSGTSELLWVHENGSGTNNTATSTAMGLKIGEWVHIALVRDTTNNNILFYKNGVLVNTISYTNEATGGSTADLYLGSAYGAGSFFDGKMDDIRIWTDMRTEQEIKDNMFKDVSAESNLASYYKMEDDYTDEIGNNDLTSSGSPVFSTDRPYNAERDVDGLIASLDLESSSAQYANISDASQTGLDLTGDFTFEAWIKPESLPSSGNGMFLVSKDNITNRSYSINAIYNSSGTYRLYVEIHGDVGTEQVYWNWTPVAGQWYHIAITYDVSEAPASAFKFYLNGVSQASPTVSVNNNNTAIDDTAAAFDVGRRGDGNANLYFDGLIKELRAWNDVRTASEIRDNIFADVTGQDNLVGYWKFEDDYTDETGNNDLTSGGSPVFSDNIPFQYYDGLSNQLELESLVQRYDTNIRAYYKLEDVTDELGGYDLTNTGSTPFNSGKFNNSADGGTSNTTKYLRIVNNIGITGGAITMVGWIKMNENSSWKTLIEQEDATSHTANRLGYGDAGGNPYLLARRTKFGVSNTDVNRPMTFEVGEWYHLAYTYDGSTMKLYVNGIYLGSVSVSGNGTSGGTTGTSLLNSSDYASNIASAGVDDVAFFTRALSAEEIWRMYVGEQAAITSDVKTVLGVARASVKTRNGLAIGSVGSVNGLV